MNEELCRTCDRILQPEARLCICGAPTARATFAERAAWELEQWRAYQARKQSESVSG